MLLQARENREIALIHHCTAETADVPRAGAVFRFSPAVRLPLDLPAVRLPSDLRHRHGRAE
jgi:hypothetical protein